MAETLQKREASWNTHARAGGHACQPRALATLSAGNMALVRATDEPALWHEMCRAAVEVGGNPVAWAGYAESPAGHHRYASGVGTGREIQAGLPTVGDPRGGGHPERQACRRARPGQQRTLTGAAPRLAHVLPFASCVALPFDLDGQRGALFSRGSRSRTPSGKRETPASRGGREDYSFGLRALCTRAWQQEADEALHCIAYHDTLTKLANQARLAERLQACLAEARRQASRFALLVLDIHQLGEINAALGFHQGDALCARSGHACSLHSAAAR